MLKFSNARRSATISDWPLGSGKRGPCTFTVEAGSRGERISRVTTGKPKYTTYAQKACIVDGENGKTYLLLFLGDAVRIAQSDMQHDATREELGLPSAYVFRHHAEFEALKVLSAS